MENREELSKDEIIAIYDIIKEYHQKFLEQQGVRLPKLYTSRREFTKDALTLVYLARNYPKTEPVSKEELTKFIRRFYPDVNDVQQARHLGAQKGFYIVSGGRADFQKNLRRGYYQLITLKEAYPAFHGHRIVKTEDWEELKAQYGYRCATCGSKEGEPSFHWPDTITRLQKAHMDPRKPLESGNIIPQCEKCNRGDRNRWIYDERGRVIKIANPSVINSCDEKVQLSIYKILSKKFKNFIIINELDEQDQDREK